MTGEARWTELFDRLALFLTLLAFLLRIGVPSANAGAGLNLFIHLLFWIALTLWFAGRGLAAGGTYRFSGLEFPFLAFVAAALMSVLRAGFKLPALEHAFTYLSLMLFFVLCVQLIGKQQLLAVLLSTLFTLSIYALVQYFVLFRLLEEEARVTESIEFARRIRSNEVFATLGGPNQFAGFLALLLPVVAGSLIDTREFRLRGAMLAAGLAAIALTGSTGGFVALAGGAATMAALGATRARGRTLVVAIGGGAAAIAIALLLWSPLLSWMDRNHSMHVRAVYWRATGKIVASAPILGVGLDNWQEHYFHAKSEVQQESTRAHNDYLQILAELGIVGLLAFVALLAFGLRKAATRESAPESDSDPPSAWLVAGVVSVIMLLGLALAGDGVGRAIAIVLGALWLGSWLLLRRMTPTTDLQWTRLGAAGGFVALLIHMFVDFQIYQFGVAAALVAVLALVVLLRGGSTPVTLPRQVCLAATAVLMAVSVPLLTFVDPRALAADNEIDDAKEALRGVRSGKASNPTLMLSEAIRIAESAQAHNPYNPVAYQLLAQAKLEERNLLLKIIGDRESKDIDVIEGIVLQALQNAIALRPLSAPLHDDLARAHLTFWRSAAKAPKATELARAKAAEHLRQAADHARRAHELYPTSSYTSYQLGRILELSKDGDAAKYYKEALRLSDLAGKELEDLDRLKLTTLARVRALRALGRPLEAHDLLDRTRRDAIKGAPAEQARRALERYVENTLKDELDDRMTPVLKDVVEAIMRDLK